MITLLASCRKHLITGTIRLSTREGNGIIELRAGVADTAKLGELCDDAAVNRLRELHDGLYELTQRLPELSGDLGAAASCEGDLGQVPLVKIMRHCEDQALSCTITIVSEFERGQIVYRAGEITDVVLNGNNEDDDAIVDIVSFETGRFKVSAPPLPVDIGGWPSARKDPTVPFKIEQLAVLPPKKAKTKSTADDDAKPEHTKPRPRTPVLPGVPSIPELAPRIRDVTPLPSRPARLGTAGGIVEDGSGSRATDVAVLGVLSVAVLALWALILLMVVDL